ncbi:4-(cytidine 5'-diphospho)-2-C-methyl-D-erythritol kinase [Ruminococcus sp. Marseille-P6503]|uniref:4-(cytidine 5'-diphospho)-2-C-methyl-D-erythritol kinase n=1 Tax=Ruminococcus sp. Marseille-P6503 TaxID=2364796 RepID=UPI000F533889|nr:4-(cytidine 5'-diphospho)-2-C-methyl-D-erythritol kinase [Ruminococcus sp. Marseille-P6503]
MKNRSLTIKAYGKLNLFLDITGRRSDGYHLLKTVMQSVSVCDTLSFNLSCGTGIELKCSSPGFPLDSGNLIWKAIEAFYSHIGVKPAGKITVEVKKEIPSMAGMAGGSSDCAAALAAMNELYGTGLPLTELCSIGVRLGADVPFALTGGTVLCEGIGEKLTVLPAPPEMYFAAVKPQAGISTASAYAIYDSLPVKPEQNYAEFESALKSSDLNGIAKGMFNALEAAADADEIKKAKRRLLELGAVNSMMTGSGSAVFGIFANRSDAERCIEKMSDYSFARTLVPINKGWEIIKG